MDTLITTVGNELNPTITHPADDGPIGTLTSPPPLMMTMTKLQLKFSPVIIKKWIQAHGAANAPIMAPVLQILTLNALVMPRGDFAQIACQAKDAPINRHQNSHRHPKHHKSN